MKAELQKKADGFSMRKLMRRLTRDQRGDVLPKVLLTVIALGGIIALGKVITTAMDKLNSNVTEVGKANNDVMKSGK
jgi:hypothetical protein